MRFANNRYVRDNTKKLILKVMENDTDRTFELAAARIDFPDMSVAVLKKMGDNSMLDFDIADATRVVTYAAFGAKDKTIGVYDINYYLLAFEQLKEIADNLTIDNMESRQFIIKFDKIHCFQDIHILIRNDKVKVITNMRSCNLQRNFLTDAYISYIIGFTVMQRMKQIYMNSKSCKQVTKNVDVIMNIGSLHIFKV